MDGERTFEPGEVVYLLAEIRAGGRIHEIGTRATVCNVTASEVVLELGGAHSPVACSTTHVQGAAERRTRGRRTARGSAWLRPAA